MSKYNYSKELPKPMTLGNINIESPLIKPFVDIAVGFTILKVKALKIPTIKVNDIECYVCEPESEQKLPTIVYFHGGAFMYPAQKNMAKLAQYYSRKLGCRVFMPEYRRIPEYPFPTAFNDCFDTYMYVLENAEKLHIDTNKLIILGDSAGGNLAAGVCQKLRDKNLFMPQAQVLIYPAVDNSMAYESMDKYDMAAWSKSATIHMWNMYLKNGYGNKLTYVAPLKAKTLSSLPKTFLEICECDVLHDEGLEYAKKLRADGVECILNEVKEAYHAYDLNVGNAFAEKQIAKRIEFMKDIFDNTK